MNPSPSDAADAVPGLDAVACARWQGLPRTHSPWLHEEVGGRMAERLQWFREPPTSWLHWEPVLGGLKTHARLRAALPRAEWQVWSRDMARAAAATREAAPRSWNPLRPRWLEPRAADPQRPVQMLWANMGLHAEPQPQRLIARWHSHIATGGFLMFACLGPDSLNELREVWAAEGWPAPTHAFTDMHDWGDMLVHGGFAEPVMDMERLELTYGSAASLVDELRGFGRNLSTERFGACRGRGWRERLLAAIEARGPRTDGGRLRLTVEIVYGHAFKAAPKPPRGDATVPLDALREQLRQRRG
ncbi:MULTISPECIES: biotin synthase [unclassified Hydrogenophaga]|uniref:biotin synthase n=1 Tax=unclassified Hydrogenophaga TaxID=2610897 RepID=UPI000ADA0791|nr:MULTISPECIES: biotin synthase [unclassified Hydrogenophaga]MBN9369690.1 biotin synthase [Hydrogenophaga sp.]